MGTILVLEDTVSIRDLIVSYLKHAGFNVLEAKTGEEALGLLNSRKIDIALLDVVLPGIDGFKVCKKIRDIDKKMGVIMLSARVRTEDKLKGFAIGADDYIEKPFNLMELIARIQSLLRRIKIHENHVEVLQSDPFTLNLSRETVYKDGKRIYLTPTEYIIFKHFIYNADRLVPREEILHKIWCNNYINHIGERTVVAVNIRRLRQKIEKDPSEPQFIQTVWGKGYIWHNTIE
ncbi:TPA: response regulator transcription factor [Bacillus cereus]|nr:response regulator transcription factor [Bacillus cereus]